MRVRVGESSTCFSAASVADALAFLHFANQNDPAGPANERRSSSVSLPTFRHGAVDLLPLSLD